MSLSKASLELCFSSAQLYSSRSSSCLMNFTSYHWFIVIVTTILFASSLISTVDSEYDPICKELVDKKLFIRMISITSGSFALITTQGNIFIGDKAEMFNPKELLFRLNTKSTLVSESFVGFNVDLRKSLPRKNEVEFFMMINKLPHMVVLNRTSVRSKVCIRMYKFGEDKAPPEADCSLPITSRFNMLLNDYSDENVVVAFNFDNVEFQEQFKLKWNNKNAKFEYISSSVQNEKTFHNNRYSPNTAFYTNHSQVALVWEVNTAQIFHIGSKEIGKSSTKINNTIKCEPIIYGAGTGTPPQINLHMNAWTIYQIIMILMGIVIIIGSIYFVVKCRQCDQGDKEKMDKRETTKKNKKDRTKINKDKMKQTNMSPTKKSKSPELKNMTSSSPSSDNRTSSSPSEGAKKKKKITKKTDTLGSTENNSQ